MLSELQIQNIAVIKEAVLTFTDGFNVMTGETGAGKSIVIDAINAVLGCRISRELIRTGCDSAFVSALFYTNNLRITDMLQTLDVPAEEDGSVLIQRRMFADGRNSCKINGVTVTVSAIRQLARFLVSIHGQSDNQTLLSPEYHCGYIDSLAQNEALRARYKTAYDAYMDAKRRLSALNTDESEKQRRLDILNYQIAELEAAEITEGETAQLEERLNVLRNAERISELLQQSYAALNGAEGEGGASSLAFSAADALNRAAAFSAEFSEAASGVREAAYALSEYADTLRNALYSDDFDSAAADAIEERLDTLYTLRRKYGETEADMLAFLENARQEREQIEMSDEIREELTEFVSKTKAEASEIAAALSDSRKKAADLFCENVRKELHFLDMPSVQFLVQNTPGELTENGTDNLEFLLSANAGEAPKPLAKIASGGELSRIMLAIKSVLAEKDEVETLIFDEVDTGVSGRAAQKIAIKLAELAKSHQILCVTHLAQLAAFADTHFRIEKTEHDGQTFTDVAALDDIGRKHELARILGGLTVTELQLQNAQEMLENAKLLKNR